MHVLLSVPAAGRDDRAVRAAGVGGDRRWPQGGAGRAGLAGRHGHVGCAVGRSRQPTEPAQRGGPPKVERAELGSRFGTDMWAVPWNDLGNQPNLPSEGAAQWWLASWAATQFPVI